jgi:dephospho-CoA kinase
MIHPAVGLETKRLCDQYQQEGHPATIIEAALHAEDGTLRPGLDALILVICPDPIRIQRLNTDRGLTEEEALARIQSQTPPEKKVDLAKWIIHNDQDIQHLHNQVDQILKEL